MDKETDFRDEATAFADAVADGVLSTNPDDDNYCRHFNYCGHFRGVGMFKHKVLPDLLEHDASGSKGTHSNAPMTRVLVVR